MQASEEAISQGKIRIARDRLFERLDRFGIVFVVVRPAAFAVFKFSRVQIKIIGGFVARGRRLDQSFFRGQNFRLQRCGDAQGQITLRRKQICSFGLEALGPNLLVVCGVN